MKRYKRDYSSPNLKGYSLSRSTYAASGNKDEGGGTVVKPPVGPGGF